MIKSIKKHRGEAKKLNSSFESAPSPIVVHCSAGIGRTGTLIAIFAIIEAIEYLHGNGANIISEETLTKRGSSREEIAPIINDY